MTRTLVSLSLAQRFLALIAVFAMGFSAYGAWSLKTLAELQVNGPVYQRIVQGKDLIADVLPPPAYILESYLTALQLAHNGSEEEKNGQVAKLQRLKTDYDLRHDFWSKATLEGELAQVFLKQAHEPASNFFRLAFDEFLPAVRQGNQQAVDASLERMKAAYSEHRQATDLVVRMTEKRNLAAEALAHEHTVTASNMMLAVLAICMLAGIAFAVLVVRSLMQSLGAEPVELGRASSMIASGNLDFSIASLPGDKHSVLYQIDKMRLQLKERMALEKDRQQSEIRATHAEAELRIAQEQSIAEREKQEIYLSMAQAAQHVLNNLLNQLQLFKLAADRSEDFDRTILALYDSITKEASDLIARLSNVTQPTSQNIRDSVAPRA